MDRFDMIDRIGAGYRVGNTETGEFSYLQALKSVGKDIKDYYIDYMDIMQNAFLFHTKDCVGNPMAFYELKIMDLIFSTSI